jgi:hypothetical protein
MQNEEYDSRLSAMPTLAAPFATNEIFKSLRFRNCRA